MSSTHRDHRPGNHPTRLADALTDPSSASDPPGIDPDRGIRLEALFIAALMLLVAVSTVWSWFG